MIEVLALVTNSHIENSAKLTKKLIKKNSNVEKELFNENFSIPFDANFLLKLSKNSQNFQILCEDFNNSQILKSLQNKLLNFCFRDDFLFSYISIFESQFNFMKNVVINIEDDFLNQIILLDK